MNNNLIFKVKTIQSRVIKILIESLKDLLYEVNFIFTKEGITMNASNTSNTATICMKLMAENFEEFYCKQTKKIGISMKALYNHIKNMSDDDIPIIRMKFNTRHTTYSTMMLQFFN